MMEYDLGQLTEAGLDIVAGIGYTGSDDKYLSAVRRFYKNHEKNRDKIREYYEAEDYENYAITVHALKSNARMIGAAELSRIFEELETAAREGDKDRIQSGTASALEAYAGLSGRLETAVGSEDVLAAGELSAEEARKTADELLAALDDFDDELSKELASKLAGYPFRITQRDKLAEAAGYIDDFMYDEAVEIIKEIYQQIE